MAEAQTNLEQEEATVCISENDRLSEDRSKNSGHKASDDIPRLLTDLSQLYHCFPLTQPFKTQEIGEMGKK